MTYTTNFDTHMQICGGLGIIASYIIAVFVDIF